jgi:TonB family protein
MVGRGLKAIALAVLCFPCALAGLGGLAAGQERPTPGDAATPDLAPVPRYYAMKLYNRLIEFRNAHGNAAGDVLVAFTISRSGELLSRKVEKSSGNMALDQQALEIVDRASPFPPVPPEMEVEELTFEAPFVFRIFNPRAHQK